MTPQLLTGITAFHKAIEERPFNGKCAPKCLLSGSPGKDFPSIDICEWNEKRSSKKKQLGAKWKKENGKLICSWRALKSKQYVKEL
jgi:hypothetical protein